MRQTTQRTMKYLREQGFTVYRTEKWIPLAGDWKKGHRMDVWGFGDLLAIREQLPRKDHPRKFLRAVIALVQSCAYTDHARHKIKIEAIPEFHLWKKCGGTVILISWKKRTTAPRVEIL